MLRLSPLTWLAYNLDRLAVFVDIYTVFSFIRSQVSGDDRKMSSNSRYPLSFDCENEHRYGIRFYLMLVLSKSGYHCL